VLRVPSAVIPDECNYVLNPRHPDFVRVEIGAPQELAVDRRLLG
jgi:RES domain-containing protein